MNDAAPENPIEEDAPPTFQRGSLMILAGPTASGKTTFANEWVRAARGRKVFDEVTDLTQALEAAGEGWNVVAIICTTTKIDAKTIIPMQNPLMPARGFRDFLDEINIPAPRGGGIFSRGGVIGVDVVS